MRHVRVLSSDDFEGREPGTSGESKTINYIAGEFAKAGLSPVNADFSHAVPLKAMSAKGDLRVRTRSGLVSLDAARDLVVQASGDLSFQDEELVFAGYGITAPEFGHDDYASANVAGKVVILLPGEPDGFPVRARSRLEARALDAIAESKRTYHQWSWMKHLNAYRHGARAVFILGSDQRLAASRRYFEQNYMLADKLAPWAPPLSGFLSDRLFAKGGPLGTDFENLRALAASPDFRAVPLPLRLSGTVKVNVRPFVSHNVVGKIAGGGTGCVVLTAHWDAFGRDPSAKGDNVWNGAVDDAGGIAQLIEIAGRLAAQGEPQRTIYFVAVTGEERNFLGSRHFVENSPCPPMHVAAALNLDWFWELGRTRRFASHGLGYSSLDDIVDRLVRERGQAVTAENAFYAGSDQLPFMLAGIPGFFGGSVSPLIDQPRGFEEAYYDRRDSKAIDREGHSNEDEVQPEWDLRGAVDDAELFRRLTWAVSNDRLIPCWKVNNWFSHGRRICR